MRSFFILGFIVLAGFIACKKDKGDDTLDGRFQGLWAESADNNITLVVTKDASGDASSPNMFLNIGNTAYPMHYSMNDAGDMIYLTSNEGTNKPYQINFTANRNTFTIKKFHSALPNTDPLTFNKVH